MELIRPKVEFIDNIDRNAILLKIANVAKTCYKSGEIGGDQIEKASKMVRNLAKMGHDTMLEHAGTFSVRITCSRGISHELVRHRIASFAQESQRYCRYGNSSTKPDKDIRFIIPSWSGLRAGQYRVYDNEIDLFTEDGVHFPLERTSFSEMEQLFLEGLEYSETYYNRLIDVGAQPQQARDVLPNATATQIVVTMNLRSWKHFFNLRSKGTTGAPHPDMKVIADMIYSHFSKELPEIFE